MSILIIATTDKENEWEADAAVLPNGKILVGPSAISSMADTLLNVIEK